MNKRTYIGDGVYVSFDGFQLCLQTSDGVSFNYTIWLDPVVFETLVEYAKAAFAGSSAPAENAD